MKPMALLGVILIVLGTIGLLYGGITYYTDRHVVDMGDFHFQVDEKQKIPMSPVAGTVAVLVGAFLIMGARNRSKAGL